MLEEEKAAEVFDGLEGVGLGCVEDRDREREEEEELVNRQDKHQGKSNHYNRMAVLRGVATSFDTSRAMHD